MFDFFQLLANPTGFFGRANEAKQSSKKMSEDDMFNEL
jgi:hypothetical protein